MKFEKEFKGAISDLPDKEKDKLILRLLKRDRILAGKLHFELLGFDSREDLREATATEISKRVRLVNPGFRIEQLTKEMRALSTRINEHVKITTDKWGEVSLNLLLLNEVLEHHGKRVQQTWWSKADRFYLYVVARAFKILILLQALHEDQHLDFREDLERLGEAISEHDGLRRSAIRNGLDLNWLVLGEVPEDIKAIYTNLRKEGYLKN